ncbi:MAG: amino acid adenylation domain-containing protein [Saprospiraceae bacterium]
MSGLNLTALWDEVVVKHRARTALRFTETLSFTYEELDGVANQIAGFLSDQGVSKGDRVAICLEKSVSAYAIIFACLKIGAPYVALDPRNPRARLADIIDQCCPSILFRQADMEHFTDTLPSFVCPDGAALPGFCTAYPRNAFRPVYALNGSEPAYLMFTSGSTGSPKGAVMSRDNLFHFIDWTRTAYGFLPEDVHTHLNPLYFDNTVFDIYSTLFSGGSLVPFDFNTLQSPGILAKRIREMGCSVWFSVPTLLIFLQVMKVVNENNLGTLRKIIFGGEGYPKPKLRALRQALPGARLFNVYGPTECTCICSSREIEDSDFTDPEGFPALGDMTPVFNYYILDGDNPAPKGEIGELCLGGVCVGLGYWNRKALTEKVFVQNPLNTAYSERIYRTGDLVRLNPKDGLVYFMGRKDFQIKHQGYRIELQEIETALNEYDAVDQVGVVYIKNPDKGGEIIAFLAPSGHSAELEIREFARQRLPAYMIPSRFCFLDSLPKNANGKIDRNQLVNIAAEGKL